MRPAPLREVSAGPGPRAPEGPGASFSQKPRPRPLRQRVGALLNPRQAAAGLTGTGRAHGLRGSRQDWDGQPLGCLTFCE